MLLLGIVIIIRNQKLEGTLINQAKGFCNVIVKYRNGFLKDAIGRLVVWSLELCKGDWPAFPRS